MIPADALTIDEVAGEVRRPSKTVRRWIATGVRINGVAVRLAAVRVGGRILVGRAAVAAFLAACNPGAVAPVETPAATARRFKAEKARLQAELNGGRA